MKNISEIYKHRNEIENYIVLKLQNQVVAEELTDKVLDKAEKYPYNPSKQTTLLTWLITITNSVIIDYTRTRKKVYSVSAFTDENGNDMFELEADEPKDNSDLKKALANAFNSLKPNYKRIAILYFKNNMKYEEIANICDVPMGTVKGMISRCRAMLQAELQTVRTM